MSLLANQIVKTSQIFHVVNRGGVGGGQKGLSGGDQMYQNYSAVSVSHLHTFEINFWKNQIEPFSSPFGIFSLNIMDCLNVMRDFSTSIK